MFYDTFDTGFGMPFGFNTGIQSAFASPIFNGSGCFPMPSVDMGFNSVFTPSFNTGFNMDLPITCGYSPAPFGCNPVSMDLSGNICIDGIPITPDTPPAWMTERAMQAEMRVNQLEAQLNDHNFWMNFIPQNAFYDLHYSPFNETINIDRNATDYLENSFDAKFSIVQDQMCGGLMENRMQPSSSSIGLDSPPESPLMYKGEEILPCGLTQSSYDSFMTKYQDNLASQEHLLESINYENTALRAMIQNNISRIKRDIEDLDKPLGNL